MVGLGSATWAATDAPRFSSKSTAEDFFGSHALPEPLVPTAPPTVDENGSLADSLNRFEARTRNDDFSALETFAEANPASPWRLAVLTNLGLLEYHAGYYSKCIPAYLAAWNAGKSASEPKAKALADRSAGEYTKMLARLGRYPELKAFLASVKGRKFIGQASELMMAGIEGSTTMEKRPEISFRCGPMALSRILASEKSPLWASPEIFNSKSTMKGMSLAEVEAISKKLGMNYQAAKRSPGAVIITPSVIHWKVGHYAALIEKVGNQYHSQDPTFENDTWHSQEALESEASGYFLVPPGPLPPGWTAVSEQEAATVFGKGNTTGPNPNPGPTDKPIPPPPPPGDPPCPGMTSYSFKPMLTSLMLNDSPVGYRPPYGDPMYFTATYLQRDPNQPSNFTYSNLGPKWSFNWQQYVTDDPTNYFAALAQYKAQANEITYPSYSSGGGGGGYETVAQFDTYSKLKKPKSGLPYTITNPDGSQDIFGQPDGSKVAGRKVFLTQHIDPVGNATTISYDKYNRITTVSDALGQKTTFSYGLGSDIYKITKVTDPFGRYSTFSYDDQGRLASITDTIGIESSFAYDGASDFVNVLTTPYGITTFTSVGDGSLRQLTATDPAGATEVLQSNGNNTPAITDEDPSVVPTGFQNIYLTYRNSFYWNKKQWREHPNDYSQCHIYHWLHDTNMSQTSPVLESEKAPLESRIWYAYPGQTSGYTLGTQSTPDAVGRVVETGTAGTASQITRSTLNVLGYATSVIDPLGRTTGYNYAANNLDVLSMTQNTASGLVTLGTYTWNGHHRPLTYTDAAGQTTAYTWNAAGQLTSVTNAKDEKTGFTYYTANASGKQRKGHLAQIQGALPGNSDTVSFDYDSFGNVASVTGPDGYTLAFTYDAMNRLTRVTYPDSTYSQTTYLLLDPQTSRDRLGRITTYVYDNVRHLQSVTDPLNRTISYGWCKCGELNQLIDALGRVTSWTRDSVGRVTAKTYADGSTINYAYEPLSGRLSTITDEQGQIKGRYYNLDNTLAGLTYTNGQHTTPNVSFTYDTDFLRLKSMVDGIGTTTYAYNPIASGTLGAGQLASVNGPFPNDDLTYKYDELGRNSGYAVNGVGETRTFDAIGRVLSAVNPLGTFGYSYIGATSRMANVTYPNGMICAYDYNDVKGDFRLQDINYTLPGNTPLSKFSYQYNAVGDITRWTQISTQAGLNRSWLCGYDAADQLISVSTQDPATLATSSTGQYSYTYDPAGNRLTETIDGVTSTASFNTLNQLISITTSGTSTLPQQTYEWDAENRLSAINYTGTNERSEFEYDGYNRRTGVRELQGSTVISYNRYGWLGMQMEEERDATGATVDKRYFSRGMQLTGKGGLETRLFARDHLGSVRQVSSMSGALTSTYDFDPWGRRSLSGGTDETSLAFTVYFFHSPSGLAISPFRAYKSNFGQWLSRDPLIDNAQDLTNLFWLDYVGAYGGMTSPGLEMTENPYSYSGENPIGNVDPLGLWTVTLGGSLNFSIGNLNFAYNAGIAFDGYGNFGLYQTPGAGLGVGSGGYSALNGGYSNAPTICQLRGNFWSAGGGYYRGAGGSGGHYWGQNDGYNVSGYEGSFGAGWGGGGASVTQTNTTISIYTGNW
jgi:RHS repeat-associated protein